jgi:hypothetical protein
MTHPESLVREASEYVAGIDGLDISIFQDYYFLWSNDSHTDILAWVKVQEISRITVISQLANCKSRFGAVSALIIGLMAIGKRFQIDISKDSFGKLWVQRLYEFYRYSDFPISFRNENGCMVFLEDIVEESFQWITIDGSSCDFSKILEDSEKHQKMMAAREALAHAGKMSYEDIGTTAIDTCYYLPNSRCLDKPELL